MKKRYTSNLDKLQQWLQRQWFKHSGLLSLARLTHGQGRRDRDNLVEEFPFERDATDDAIAFMAEVILQAAEDHAESLTGHTERYALAVVGESVALARTGFRVSTYDVEEDEDTTEPPTKRGIMGQQMRHNEGLVKLLVQAQMTTATAQERIIERQSLLLEGIFEKQLRLVALTEEVLSKKAERELAVAESAARLDAKRDIFQSVKLLLPTVVNRIAGDDILPKGGNPAAMALETLAETLTDAQLEAIVNAVEPDQGEQLIAMMEQIGNGEGAIVLVTFRNWAAGLSLDSRATIGGVLGPAQQTALAEILGLDPRGRPHNGEATH